MPPRMSFPGTETIVPTVEYEALYRTFVQCELILKHLDHVGWPRSMNAAVDSFRKAIERYQAARRVTGTDPVVS